MGNPIASIIHSMQLEKNTSMLTLPHPEDDGCSSEEGHGDEDEDEEREGKPKRTILVDVSIDMTAYANIARHFDTKKKSQGKSRLSHC